MSPPAAPHKRRTDAIASGSPSLPFILPIAAVAGNNAIVITPTPVFAPRQVDSREEHRDDATVAETLPRAKSITTKFRRQSPPPTPSSWPALQGDLPPQYKTSQRSEVDKKTEISVKRNPQRRSGLRKPKPQPSHHDRVSAARRIYEPEATANHTKTRKPRERTPPSATVLDPLDRHQLLNEAQQRSLARAVETRIDRASRVVPLQFLRDHEQHHAFAQRVVLLAMVRVLQRHYHRVTRAAYMEWKKHTLTRRILEDHARKQFLLRQSSLAHACAIVQRHILTRMRALWTKWAHATELLRMIEQERSAGCIQKCWRAWNMRHKLKTLALLYRDRVRHASATAIQSMVRRFLARCEMARVVWLHKRHVAAVRIQQVYRNYVIRQIALHHRQVLAAICIQRVWRGVVGRARAQARRITCRMAAERCMAEQRWYTLAIDVVIMKHRCASQIQRCGRAFVYRQRISRGMRRCKHRRRLVPACRIQNTWHVYRAAQLRMVVDTVVFRVVMTHVAAVRRIQQCFRRHWYAKVDAAARQVTRLLRCFHARRTVMSGFVMHWLSVWRVQYLDKWSLACGRDTSKWAPVLRDWQHRLHAFALDQTSPHRRLNVKMGLRLILQCKEFEAHFRNTRASDIQRMWRWYRLCVLIAQLRHASTLLKRAIPALFRQHRQRVRRQRVLQRWKRQRYMDLRSRFDHWKQLHLLQVQARDLVTTTRKLRKALWFHHHKLRKRMMCHWWAFVLRRRGKRRQLHSAIALHRMTEQQRYWHAWRREALPQLCCANRLHEMTRTLTVWKTWIQFVARKNKSKRARFHHDRVLKHQVLAAWRQDRVDFFQELETADRFQDMHTVQHTFDALVQYVTKMKQVRTFCRVKQQAYGVRHWLERVYEVKQFRESTHLAYALREKQLKRTMWRQWLRYKAHQARQRSILCDMDRHYGRRRMRCLIKAWSRELVPMWKDYHLIESVAVIYRARKLKELYFRNGLAQFWALTAGARRIAMAVRIQRAYRGKRARTKIVVMRLKIKYQLETRATMGVDVQTWTTSMLQTTLASHEWVFVLFSFPWMPVDASVKTAFFKTATTWMYLRSQASRMAFGLVDATQMMNDPAHEFSLMSWLGLQPTQLPCVVGFWKGVGPPVVTTTATIAKSTSRLANGETRELKRRFKAVCTADALVYTCISQPSAQGEKAPPVAMSRLVAWIERLQYASHDATAIDLQSYVRGFLARRHTKRRRVLKRQRQLQRIRAWIRTLTGKWEARKQENAAVTVQKWIRQIYARRCFWIRFRLAMETAKQAIRRLQRAIRVHLCRKRVSTALLSLLATCDRYPNAPLCQECFQDVSHKQLARLRCRDCQQAYCADCFGKTHRSGKRLLHLCDSIDFVAMNDDGSKMCERCEVRGVARICRTCCAPGDDSNGEEATCLGCFELRHTDSRVATAVNTNKRQRRRSSWWVSQAFQQHDWRRVPSRGPEAPLDSTTVGATASTIMEKFGWQSKNRVLRKQQEVVQVQESLREREDKLLAIRLQQEAILRDAFDRFDMDHSGAIDRSEFKRMFKEELCEPLTDPQVDEAMARMDKSGNGLVEFEELLAWFAEETLAKVEKGNGDGDKGEPRSLAMLKDALKAKRQMRRYKEKLHEFVPSVSLTNVADQPKRVLVEALSQLTLRQEKTTQEKKKKTVPGFPSVECLEHGDFARKRKVFFRFVHEICGLDWIYEDEATIPVANTMEVFDQVFLPRWNAGELTYDFYFDDESFEFEGEVWQRKWEATAKRYVFTTTRRKMRKTIQPTTTAGSDGKRRNSQKRKSRARASISSAVKDPPDASQAEVEIEETVEIVELIDPRRKQMLLQEAQEAFTKADADGSGFIDEHEFHRMLTLELCEPVSKSKAREIMKQLDVDGSGKMDFHEFFQWYAVDKCQDYPLTSQMERTKALLKTRRRAKATAATALHASVATGQQLTQAFARKKKEQQLAQDCKGASRELIELLQDGYEKRLAEKALTLHNQDVAFARQWLLERQHAEQQERDQKLRELADRKAQAKKDKRAKQHKRRLKMKATRQYLKNLFIGPSKKEAHAARIQQALTNLDREILLVEEKLHGKDEY